MRRAIIAVPVAAALAAATVFLLRPEPEKRTPVAHPLRPVAAAPEPLGPQAVERLFEKPADAEVPAARAVVNRLRDALAAMAEEDLALARVRLAKFLEENPGEIGGFLAAFEAERDPDVLLLLAQAIGGDAAAMENPLVAEAMLRIASASDLPERRGAALQVLGQLPRPDVRATETVLRIAREEAPRGVRIDALGVAAAWMQRFPDSAAGLGRAVLALAAEIRDDEVRGNAIQAVALLDRAPDAEAMARFLHDTNLQNRNLAAMGMGAAGAAGVPALEGALRTEGSVEERRGMLIHLVRAAGAEAPEVLARVALRDRALAGDIRDYQEILKSERDPLRAWALKQERDLARGEVSGAHDHRDD